MTIPIRIEPTAAGFRATADEPFDVSAEGPTADAAVSALRMRLIEQAGVEVTPSPVALPGVVPLSENPLFDDWLKAVEQYRDEVDAADTARGV